MKPSFFRPQILQQNVQMDGSINFMTNGDINVYPCPWEDEKQVTGGERVRYRAGIEVDADGRTRVKRYNDGLQGPKRDVLYETPHGAVKITRPLYRSDNGHRRLKDEYVYITFKFPKKYGLALTKALYQEEADQILSYLKTRKEEAIWK
ncbi:MAG: hypothetical protein J5708_04900 [Bacteroidales bacterium]|nr:hypothetical protein [Bacteroidales bacterium]MBR5678301.1 hypothetical protein [Paludibacteraceae bacterium]